jgi:UDPglucose--hexose-1-phosphate uridylyltransferase
VSEERRNELRDEQVVYAIHRQDRTFLPSREHCPLCPTRPGGEETEIPFPAFAIAVFENRFPAFQAPRGAAEVVVYTDRHDDSFGTLAPQRAEALMWVWRERFQELGARADVEYVMIFENRGVEVGVTLHHPHGQIYGYPFLPPVPQLELAADERLGGCAPCALLARELEDGRRIVYENEGVVAYVPYAARWPYEAHVVLREHRPSLLDCEPEELRLLADGLQALARGYDALFDRPFPYVMVVHQAPTGTTAAAPGSSAAATSRPPGAAVGGGHLHVEFYPPLRTAEKLKYLAGSEQGAGTFISDVLPEESAALLGEAILRAT